jgi:hypothetical protein
MPHNFKGNPPVTRSWIVTLPKTVAWESYEEELAAVADGSQVMNYRLPRRPATMAAGDRMYITHQGIVKGWMAIQDVVHKPDGFTCTTTGTFWEPGWYVERTGTFHAVAPFAYPGFQGYRELKGLVVEPGE